MSMTTNLIRKLKSPRVLATLFAGAIALVIGYLISPVLMALVLVGSAMGGVALLTPATTELEVKGPGHQHRRDAR